MQDQAEQSVLVRYRMLWLALLGLIVLVPFLGAHDLWYPDEPDVGQVAQAMYESGDWVAPRRNDVIWVDYPPMVYWAGSIASHAFGAMSAFSLRLPSALAALLLVLLTCAAASRWYGPRVGLWAGFAQLCFLRIWYEGQGVRPDMLFSLWIGAGMFSYVAGCGERRRWWLRALGFVCFGLAMLAKGPLGLLLPGLVLTLWHASRRNWRLLLEQVPLSLLALAVYMPWFLACAQAMGADDILHELWEQNIARFLEGAKRGHQQPFTYYFVNVWPDMLPWSLLLPFALWWSVRRGGWRERNELLALLWFGVFFAFLTIAETKRQVYLLPAYPAAAILIARYIAALGGKAGDARPDPRPAKVVTMFFAALFMTLGVGMLVGAAAYGVVLGRPEFSEGGPKLDVVTALRWPIVPLGAVFLLGGLWIVAARRRGELTSALARLGGTVLALFTVVSALILPALEPVKSYAPAAAWIRAEVGNQPTFGFADPDYSRRKMGAMTFYSGVLVEHIASEAEVVSYFEDNPDSIVLVNEKAIDRIFTTPRDDWPWPVVQELRASRYRYLVLRAP